MATQTAPCHLRSFGGAIDAGETPWHAALRETGEEIEGIDVSPDALAARLEAPCEHGCGWSYTTFAVRVRDTGPGDLPRVRVATGRAAWETAGLAWVPADRVAAHPGLHPGLRAAWPALRRLIRGRTGSGNSRTFAGAGRQSRAEWLFWREALRHYRSCRCERVVNAHLCTA